MATRAPWRAALGRAAPATRRHGASAGRLPARGPQAWAAVAARALATSGAHPAGARGKDEAEQRRPFPVVMTGHPADGREVIETLGLVTSTSVVSRNILVDVLMAVLGVMGGPAEQYEELTSDAVVRATDGVAAAAQNMHADQVINFRLEKAVIVNRLIFGVYVFVTAYGTAVRVK